MKLRLLHILPFLLTAASSAGAQGVCSQGKGEIAGRSNGLSGVYESYDFDGLSLTDGAAITNQFGGGLSFEGAYFGKMGSIYYGPFATSALYNYDDQNASYQIAIDFLQAVNSVAFNFATSPGLSSFKVYRNNKEIHCISTASPTDAEVDIKKWWGFEFFDGTDFDRLVISNIPSQSTPFAFGFDNLQVGRVSVVPEPSTAALLAIALGALAVSARRRRQ